MKKLFTLIIALSFHLIAAAVGEPEIKPEASYPLLDHLKTVNSLWSQVETDHTVYSEITNFETEAQRIEAHLMQVITLLRNTHHPGFELESLNQRANLLNTLEKYARARDFPINTGHAYRIPYFIDFKNTPCAVGHLLIESGFAIFAEKVKTEINNAYLLDMPYDEIPVWARANGFTVDELALIQPGYPPTTNWQPLQDGVNGEVRVLLEWQEENALVIAGTFTNASGIECTNVVLWNGSGYETMGDGIEGNIVTGAVLDGEIYLGGSLGANVDLARWTGEEWELTGVFVGSGPPEITDLYVHDGELYAAGLSIGFAGVSYGVAKLETSGWEFMPGDFNGPIYGMTHYNEQLVIGGAFTGFNFTDPEVPYIATWNGSEWNRMGTAFLGIIYTVTVFHDTLVAGGRLPVGGVSNDVGVIYFDETTQEWVSVYSDPFAPFDHEIKELQVIGDKLLVCGRYEASELVGIIGGNAGYIYHLHEDIMPVPIVWNDGPVYSAAQWGNALYIGGEFAHINLNEAVDFNNVMYYTLTTDVNDVQVNQVGIYPNPTATEVRIDAGDERVETVKLYDMRGALVHHQTIGNEEPSIEISSLQAGTYVMEIHFVGVREPVRKKIVVQ